MMRLAVIGLALMAGACTIDGPEPGSTDVMAELERQERIRQQEAERQRLCSMLDPETDRYERDCGRGNR
ncbi:hypothetical protein [Brevundimonas sp.]|uniref:hypothetical protein n=1 Tax=Brevundimonas sp. TaxID=1871086 RepID=UPI0025EA1396|nr:hypothetical protein [Brevundimonas sp.]